MDNGKANEASSGANNGVEEEIDNFFNDGTANDTELNRNELMKLTGKQLAKMAQPYSTFQIKTLERMSKANLCDIILAKSSKQKDEVPHARTARTESQTEQFITTALMMLSAMKQNRDGEPINAMAAELFKKQAVVHADEKVKAGEMDIDKSSNALLYLSAGAILFDGLIGFKNTPGVIEKVKNKFFKRPGQKVDEKTSSK